MASNSPTSRRRPPTLHDIAEHAGVSVRTVSRVVNRQPGPAEATRVRVQASIDELGYRPNLLARGLVTRQSYTLGLVATYITDPFFTELAKGIQSAGDELGYLVFLTSSEGDAERQEKVVQSLADRGVDGIIVFPVRGAEDQLISIADRGVPVVSIDHRIAHRNMATVEWATERGAHLAVEHLIASGRTRIGMLSSRSAEAMHESREDGFRDAVKSLGNDVRSAVVWVDETIEGGASGVQELKKRIPDLDGVFAYTDVMAIGALRQLEADGSRVPDDVAVIGFDDVALSAMVRPALTTVRIDREQMGTRAVGMLMQLLDDPGATPPPEVLDVTLVVRDSA